LAGFYGADNLFVSGAFRPAFNDMEIFMGADLNLEIGVDVNNGNNFIAGRIITPRSFSDVHLNFEEDAFHSGATDFSNVDGYVAVRNKQNFIFPTGDNARLRPLHLQSETMNTSARAAYFREDPNETGNASTPFSTSERTEMVTAVSSHEYWVLDGEVASNVRLAWDVQSNFETFISSVDNLIIVGWNIEEARWESLGNTLTSGDLLSGHIVSDPFVPGMYAAITFGESLVNSKIPMSNYLLTPNADGRNDVLIIEGVERSSDNELQIYNRYGVRVYGKTNYNNDFNGFSNRSMVVNRHMELAAGIYFYIFTLHDLDQKHQGYLYISK
jgi:gliding motility-associated-like protein